MTERVIFHPAVNQEELWRYIGAVDVGMILAPAVTKNAFFSLPNKFFENISAGTPIICPHYPEMKRLIDTYEIGLTCDPEDIESINNCVERLRTDKELYTALKANIKKAQIELNWNNERKVLYDHYKSLIV